MKSLKFYLFILFSCSFIKPAYDPLFPSRGAVEGHNPYAIAIKPEWQRRHAICPKDFMLKNMEARANAEFPMVLNMDTDFSPTYLTRIGLRLAVLAGKLECIPSESRGTFSEFFDESARQLEALIAETRERPIDNGATCEECRKNPELEESLKSAFYARCEATTKKVSDFYAAMNAALTIKEGELHALYLARPAVEGGAAAAAAGGGAGHA